MKCVWIRLPGRLDGQALGGLRCELEAVPEASIIVLTGANEEVFCEGLAFEAMASVSSSQRRQGLDDFHAIAWKLACGGCPSIARVRGRALGGGLGLAAACDVALAHESARFALPETLFGLIPGMILPILALRAPGPTLRRRAISGASFSAQEALEEGMVDEVSDDEGMRARVRFWSRSFARAEAKAVARLKGWMGEMADLEDNLLRAKQELGDALDDPVARARIEKYGRGLTPW